MSNTFYWHDYETFGLRGDERRPSQFAGVRTDENLNFIGEEKSSTAGQTAIFSPLRRAVF